MFIEPCILLNFKFLMSVPPTLIQKEVMQVKTAVIDSDEWRKGNESHSWNDYLFMLPLHP